MSQVRTTRPLSYAPNLPDNPPGGRVVRQRTTALRPVVLRALLQAGTPGTGQEAAGSGLPPVSRPPVRGSQGGGNPGTVSPRGHRMWGTKRGWLWDKTVRSTYSTSREHRPQQCFVH